MNVAIITTTVACQSSFHVGQVTLANSSFVCCRKFPFFETYKAYIPFLITAGLAGLEPATCGFGDRRSTNWSYRPLSR